MSGIMLALAAALGAPPAAAASPQSAPVEQLYAALLQVMKAGKATPFQQRYAMLAPSVEAAFNLDEILQSAVGPRWATMQPNEQAALRDAFRRYTIATYLSNFDSYSGQRFDVTPTPRAVGSDQVVETRIIPASGEQHRLDYVMRPTGAGWKIVDVLADGVDQPCGGPALGVSRAPGGGRTSLVGPPAKEDRRPLAMNLRRRLGRDAA